MARHPLLSPSELERRLAELSGWSFANGALRRELEFADFSEAFAFMTRVALEAEKLDHHPDWSNSYRRVTLELTTHDSGGVTEQDYALARAVNAILAR